MHTYMYSKTIGCPSVRGDAGGQPLHNYFIHVPPTPKKTLYIVYYEIFYTILHFTGLAVFLLLMPMGESFQD